MRNPSRESRSEITHMLFVDDVMLFVEATLTNIQNVLAIIELFCQGSIQRINSSKSSVFSRPGIPRQVSNMLFRINGFQKAFVNFSYLGFPIIKSSQCYDKVAFLVDRAKKKTMS